MLNTASYLSEKVLRVSWVRCFNEKNYSKKKATAETVAGCGLKGL